MYTSTTLFSCKALDFDWQAGKGVTASGGKRPTYVRNCRKTGVGTSSLICACKDGSGEAGCEPSYPTELDLGGKGAAYLGKGTPKITRWLEFGLNSSNTFAATNPLGQSNADAAKWTRRWYMDAERFSCIFDAIAAVNKDAARVKGVAYGSAEPNMCDFHCAPGSLCNTMVQWPSHGCTAQYIEYPTDLTLGIYIAAGTIFGFFACIGIAFLTSDWRRNGGFVELIMYSFRVARNNWKDNSICLLGCFVPAGYTVVRNWVYVEMIAAIETLSKNTLTLQSVALDDLNSAKNKMLNESMILVGVLALTFLFKYDFEVRLPGNGARRASVLAIMDLILRNADLDFYTKDPPGALIEIFVEPALR